MHESARVFARSNSARLPQLATAARNRVGRRENPRTKFGWMLIGRADADFPGGYRRRVVTLVVTLVAVVVAVVGLRRAVDSRVGSFSGRVGTLAHIRECKDGYLNNREYNRAALSRRVKFTRTRLMVRVDR